MKVYTVTQIARLVGKHPDTIRSYIDSGLIKGGRDLNNYRVVDESQVKKLELILDGTLKPVK